MLKLTRYNGCLNRCSRLPGGKTARDLVYQKGALPIQSQSELNQPRIRIAVACNRAGSGRRGNTAGELEISVGQVEVHVVEDVEEVRPELEPVALSKRKVLHDAEVHVDEIRTGEAVAPNVSKSARDGLGERGTAAARGIVTVKDIARIRVICADVGNAGSKVWTIGELVQTTVVERGAGKDGKGETRTIIEDSGSVPATDNLAQHTMSCSEPVTTGTERKFVNIRRYHAMGYVKG